MKKAINRWAMPGKWSLDQSIAAAAAHGFEGLELNLDETGDLNLDTSPEEAEAIAAQVRDAGLEIPAIATGLYWANSLSSPNESERQRAIAIARQQIKLGVAMDVSHQLVVPGAVDVFFLPDKIPVPYGVAYKTAQRSMITLAEEAEASKVILCLENVWNRFLLSPLEFAQFIDDVHSLLVRAYFDVGNVFAYGYPEDWIRILGTRISRVHVKDFKRSVGTVDGFCDIGEGEIDWSSVMAALEEVRYDGWITAELFPDKDTDPNAFLKKTSEAMDRIMSA